MADQQTMLQVSGKTGSRRLPRFVWLGLVITLLTVWGDTKAHTIDDDMEWRSSKPKQNSERIRIKIGRNNPSYYKIEHKKPVEYVVRGPVYVKLITRQLPPKVATGKFTYTLTVQRERNQVVAEILNKEVVIAWSERARLNERDNDYVGEPEENYLYVPKGKHTLTIGIEEKGCAIAARLFAEKRKAKEDLISLTPSEYDRVCHLVQKSGNEYPHYHFTHESPLSFTVVGPTTLSIGTRLDFDQNSAQRTSYALMVKGHNAEGQTKDEGRYFKTKRLSRVSYKDCPGIDPGENQVMLLDVSAGRWTFELSLINADHPGIAARILMPKGDLGQATP